MNRVLHSSHQVLGQSRDLPGGEQCVSCKVSRCLSSSARLMPGVGQFVSRSLSSYFLGSLPLLILSSLTLPLPILLTPYVYIAHSLFILLTPSAHIAHIVKSLPLPILLTPSAHIAHSLHAHMTKLLPTVSVTVYTGTSVIG